MLAMHEHQQLAQQLGTSLTARSRCGRTTEQPTRRHPDRQRWKEHARNVGIDVRPLGPKAQARGRHPAQPQPQQHPQPATVPLTEPTKALRKTRPQTEQQRGSEDQDQRLGRLDKRALGIERMALVQAEDVGPKPALTPPIEQQRPTGKPNPKYYSNN